MTKPDAPRSILAVDPGTGKAGYAVVREDGSLLAHGIASADDIGAVAGDAVRAHGVETIIVGDGTGHREVQKGIKKHVPQVELLVVPETGSTLLAREVYFEHNPPRAWRRLVPRGLRVPPEHYDDYVAVVLARQFFAKRPGSD